MATITSYVNLNIPTKKLQSYRRTRTLHVPYLYMAIIALISQALPSLGLTSIITPTMTFHGISFLDAGLLLNYYLHYKYK